MNRNDWIGDVLSARAMRQGIETWKERHTDGTSHRLARVSLWSTTLPVAQPDLHRTFTEDAWCEAQAREYTERLGVHVRPWWDVEWCVLDENAFITDVSAAIVHAMPTSRDGVLRRVHLSSWYPNDECATESSHMFSAVYTVDLTTLCAYVESRADVPDLREYMCDFFLGSPWAKQVERRFHTHAGEMYLNAALHLWMDDCQVQECYDGSLAEHMARRVRPHMGRLWSKHNVPDFTADLAGKLLGMELEEVYEHMTHGGIQKLVASRLNPVEEAA